MWRSMVAALRSGVRRRGEHSVNRQQDRARSHGPGHGLQDRHGLVVVPVVEG